MMFIILVILTDLFLLLLLSKFFDFLQPFNLSHHNSYGFSYDMLFIVLFKQASKLANIATFILNSSHSISSFKLNQNSKL